MTDFSPHIVLRCLYTARDAGVIWLASKNLNDCVIQLTYLLHSQIHSGYLLRYQSTLVCVPECRITDEIMNAQQPLNMTGVSKHRQKSSHERSR